MKVTMNNVLHGYEAYIPPDSTIIGSTIGEIEQDYQIKFEHIHNSPTAIETRQPPRRNIKLKPGMTIKIQGPTRNIDRLCNDRDLP